MNPKSDLPRFPGDVTRNLLIFGQRVDVWFEPDLFEVDRRAQSRLGAITDADGLRSLMTLPIGLPVRMMDLAPLDLLVLETLGEGAVVIHDSMVTRHARPPVRLTGLVKHAERWDDIQAVSLLRTHAPRLVLASEPLARRVLKEADPDIGIAITTESSIVLKRKPGSRWLRPSWQRWLLAEAVFAAPRVTV
jgi:hypothetical protein